MNPKRSSAGLTGRVAWRLLLAVWLLAGCGPKKSTTTTTTSQPGGASTNVAGKAPTNAAPAKVITRGEFTDDPKGPGRDPFFPSSRVIIPPPRPGGPSPPKEKPANPSNWELTSISLGVARRIGTLNGVRIEEGSTTRIAYPRYNAVRTATVECLQITATSIKLRVDGEPLILSLSRGKP
jgi:hypothetical protein